MTVGEIMVIMHGRGGGDGNKGSGCNKQQGKFSGYVGLMEVTKSL